MARSKVTITIKEKLGIDDHPPGALTFEDLARRQAENRRQQRQQRQRRQRGQDKRASRWRAHELQGLDGVTWANFWLDWRFGVEFPPPDLLPVDCWLPPNQPDFPGFEGSAVIAQALDLYLHAQTLGLLAFGGVEGFEKAPPLAEFLEEQALSCIEVGSSLDAVGLRSIGGSLSASAIAARACVHHAQAEGALPQSKEGVHDLPARVLKDWLQLAGMEGRDVAATMVRYGVTGFARPQRGEAKSTVPKTLRDRINQKDPLKPRVLASLRGWAQRARSVQRLTGAGQLPATPDRRLFQEGLPSKLSAESAAPALGVTAADPVWLPRWVLPPIPELRGLLFVWADELSDAGWGPARKLSRAVAQWLGLDFIQSKKVAEECLRAQEERTAHDTLGLWQPPIALADWFRAEAWRRTKAEDL